MDFPTAYTKETNKFVSESGSPKLQEYEYSFDKEGHKMLIKKDSFIDVYSRIQADADATDINKLMERFALGDTEAININKGFYLDTRDMPKNYAEVFQRGLEAEQFFEGLPTDLKEMFDNSYSVFFTEMGSDKFDDKVKKYNSRFEDHNFEVDEKNETGEVNYNE